MTLLHLPVRRALAVLAIALAPMALAACHLDISHNAEARDEWKRSYALGPTGTIEIHNTNGRIEIVAGDGNTVEIVAERIVKAGTDEAAKTQLAAFEIRETVTPDLVKLDSSTQGINLSMNSSRQVRYKVRAPRWANIKLDTTNADIDISGVAGAFHAESTNGRVRAAGLERGANVSTTNGVISLEFAKLAESITCEATNGTITISLPKDAGATLSARVTNGGISTDGLALTVSEQSRRRLDARIGNGGPSIRLETTNGAISVKGR